MIGISLVRIATLTAIVASLLATPVKADIFTEPMGFAVAENSEQGVKWIVAFGAITPDTPLAFEVFARTIKTKGMWIVFNSGGGNIVPALILGELIRKHGFNTDVAMTLLRGQGKDSLMPGYCLSACGYAFLGGVQRNVHDGSLIGYHQFYLDPKDKTDPKTEAQAAEAVTWEIAQYLERMGIDGKLLTLASATPPSDYYEPDSDELIELHIVTGHKAEGDSDTKPAGDAPSNS